MFYLLSEEWYINTVRNIFIMREYVDESAQLLFYDAVKIIQYVLFCFKRFTRTFTGIQIISITFLHCKVFRRLNFLE